MDKIKKYYKICGVKAPGKQHIPFLNIIEDKKIGELFNKFQQEKYLSDRGIVENVIGAGKTGRKKVSFVCWRADCQ